MDLISHFDVSTGRNNLYKRDGPRRVNRQILDSWLEARGVGSVARFFALSVSQRARMARGILFERALVVFGQVHAEAVAAHRDLQKQESYFSLDHDALTRGFA